MSQENAPTELTETVTPPPIDPTDPVEPEPEPGKSRRGLVIGLITLAVVGLIGGGVAWYAYANRTITVSGTMSLMADPSPSEYSDPHFVMLSGDRCAGQGGYSDLREGASVTVYGKTGERLGLGELKDSYGEANGFCIFSYDVPDIPAGEGIYSVEVTHRGELSGSESEVDDGQLWISGTIGGN
jgi:hypothetical protein